MLRNIYVYFLMLVLLLLTGFTTLSFENKNTTTFTTFQDKIENLYKIDNTTKNTNENINEQVEKENVEEEISNNNNNQNNTSNETDNDNKTVEKSYVIELSTSEIDLLARLVDSEAGNQPYNGRVAVANVIINRILHKDFPNDIYSVIYQDDQFEVVRNGTINTPASYESRQAAIDALEGYNVVGRDVLFFWADYVPSSSWVWTREVVIQIGDHIFGRNP